MAIVVNGEKKCNSCGLTKQVCEFGIEARSKNGYKPRCKKCSNEYDRKFYSSGYSKVKIEAIRSYYKKNKIAIGIRQKAYAKGRCLDKKKYNEEYRKNNIDKLRLKANEYEKQKTRTNNEYRLIKNFRKLIYRLKVEKTDKTSIMLGYTYKDLISQIGGIPTKNESIDHKIPVTWFISGTCCKIINHLSNLQILTRSENSIKNNLFSHQVTEEYLRVAIQHIKPKYKIKLQNGN